MTALLIVWLATGQIAKGYIETNRCHQIARDVAAGKKHLADIDGGENDVEITKAECREVNDNNPVS